MTPVCLLSVFLRKPAKAVYILPNAVRILYIHFVQPLESAKLIPEKSDPLHLITAGGHIDSQKDRIDSPNNGLLLFI